MDYDNEAYFKHSDRYKENLKTLPRPGPKASEEERDAFYNAVQDFYYSL